MPFSVERPALAWELSVEQEQAQARKRVREQEQLFEELARERSWLERGPMCVSIRGDQQAWQQQDGYLQIPSRDVCTAARQCEDCHQEDLLFA
jgi:hypothetical protein